MTASLSNDVRPLGAQAYYISPHVTVASINVQRVDLLLLDRKGTTATSERRYHYKKHYMKGTTVAEILLKMTERKHLSGAHQSVTRAQLIMYRD
jgi:hypothetical protein